MQAVSINPLLCHAYWPRLNPDFPGALPANHRKYHAATFLLNKYDMITNRYGVWGRMDTLVIGKRGAQFCEAHTTIPGSAGARAEKEVH